MRTTLSLAALMTALAATTPSQANNLFDVLGLDGIFAQRRGGCCGSGVSCGCSPAAKCEPTCGCVRPSGVDGRRFAGQKWTDCCEAGPRLCPCTDDFGHCVGGRGAAVGHGPCCEPHCGCGPVSGCGPVGGCGPGRGHVGRDWFGCGLLAAIGNLFTGCTGCDSEFYWSEWHNDPPRCCDPCDRYGKWVGPPTGYRAPYDHPYMVPPSPHGGPSAGEYYVDQPGQRRTAPAGRTPTMRPVPASGPRTAPVSGRVVRKPAVGPNPTYQR